MFAIMGATGNTGGAVLRALQRRGAQVRAISRNPDGARTRLAAEVEVVAVDPADAASLAAAFAGVEGAYVLNVPGPETPDVMAAAEAVSRNVAEALAAARVPHAVALSSEGAHQRDGTGIIRTLHGFEQALLVTGVPLTRVRATFFIENWASAIGPASAEGVLPSLLQPTDRAVRIVAVADIGEAVAARLIAGADADAPVVNLVGPRDYAPDEVAEALAAILGRPVSAIAPPRESWMAALTGAGLGASYAGELAAMYDAINAGRIGFEPGVGRTERGTTELADALATLDAEATAQPA